MNYKTTFTDYNFIPHLQEQFKSVEVMESNTLCTLLVLMFTASTKRTPVLCTLDYSDHTKSLPTRVLFECEGREVKSGQTIMNV